MNNAHSVTHATTMQLENLVHLSACPNIDETLERLTAMAAAAVEAEKVSIVLWKEAPAQRPGVGPERLGWALSPIESGLHALPVQIDDLTIGELLIHRPKGVTPGNSRLLAIVALFIGKSIQVAQLQAVLRSRFAQIALAEAAGKTLGDAVALSSHNPNRVARILAKSFYRELAAAGFSVRQIINAASEIISEVSASLKKHKKRELRHLSSASADAAM